MQIRANDRDPIQWDRELRELLAVAPNATEQDIEKLIRDEPTGPYVPLLEETVNEGRRWWICRLKVGDIFYSLKVDETTREAFQDACPTAFIALLEALKTARGK